MDGKAQECCITECCSTRHAAREAEPKDYDIGAASDKERNLLKATYNRIGNMTDALVRH